MKLKARLNAKYFLNDKSNIKEHNQFQGGVMWPDVNQNYCYWPDIDKSPISVHSEVFCGVCAL